MYFAIHLNNHMGVHEYPYCYTSAINATTQEVIRVYPIILEKSNKH